MALSQETACRLAWSSAVVASAAGPGPGPDRRGTGPSALRPQEVATHDGRPRGEIGVDDHEVRIVAGRDAAHAGAQPGDLGWPGAAHGDALRHRPAGPGPQ